MPSKRDVERRITEFGEHDADHLPPVGLIGVLSAETFEPHPSGNRREVLVNGEPRRLSDALLDLMKKTRERARTAQRRNRERNTDNGPYR